MIVGHSVFTRIHIQVNQQREERHNKTSHHVHFASKNPMCYVKFNNEIIIHSFMACTFNIIIFVNFFQHRAWQPNYHPNMLSLDGEYFPVLGSNAINDHISLAHTLNEASPWIQIDLATERCVKGVTIWNRINPSESNIYIHIYTYTYIYIYIYTKALHRQLLSKVWPESDKKARRTSYPYKAATPASLFEKAKKTL